MIDDKSASDFKSKVLMALKVTEAVQYSLIGIGAFILACIVFIILKAAFTRNVST